MSDRRCHSCSLFFVTPFTLALGCSLEFGVGLVLGVVVGVGLVLLLTATAGTGQARGLRIWSGI